MPNVIQVFLKKNTAPILFFMVIAFAIASMWSGTLKSKDNTRELLDYTKSTVSEIDEKISYLVTFTYLGDNVTDKYDKTIQYLQDFSVSLREYSTRIPPKNSDLNSRKLQTGLGDFYSSIKNESVDILIKKYQAKREMINDYLNYGKIKNISIDGTKENLQKAYDSGIKILQFEKDQASLITEGNQRINKEKLNSEESDKLEKVKGILNKMNNQKLSEDDKKELQNVYNNIWPIEAPLFPKIITSDLKTKKFSSALNSIQSQVNTLVKEYNIN